MDNEKMKEVLERMKMNRPKFPKRAVVTAGMIETTGGVEVMNKDVEICTLDKGANLDMEITLGSGRGYVPASAHADGLPLGVIPVDSIFSPIKKVNYTVENTRVGNVTDYDKLTLEVWTNGALTPKEAISQSAKILINQLSVFVNLDEDLQNDIINRIRHNR